VVQDAAAAAPSGTTPTGIENIGGLSVLGEKATSGGVVSVATATATVATTATQHTTVATAPQDAPNLVGVHPDDIAASRRDCSDIDENTKLLLTLEHFEDGEVGICTRICLYVTTLCAFVKHACVQAAVVITALLVLLACYVLFARTLVAMTHLPRPMLVVPVPALMCRRSLWA